VPVGWLAEPPAGLAGAAAAGLVGAAAGLAGAAAGAGAEDFFLVSSAFAVRQAEPRITKTNARYLEHLTVRTNDLSKGRLFSSSPRSL
jgi:hypothetical protein